MGTVAGFYFWSNGKSAGRTSDQYTIAIGLWKMLEKEYIDSWYTSFAAGAVLISIPIAILFLCMQKYYVDGVSGAVKVNEEENYEDETGIKETISFFRISEKIICMRAVTWGLSAQRKGPPSFCGALWRRT